MASVSLSTCESETVVEADREEPLCDGSVDMNVFVLALFSRRWAAGGKRKLLAIPSFSTGRGKDRGRGRPHFRVRRGHFRASPRVSRSKGQRHRCGGIAR